MSGVVLGGRSREPYELPLGPGAWVTIKPLTMLDFDTAEARARLALRDLVRGSQALVPYELDGPDPEGGFFDPTDLGQSTALGQIIANVEMGMIAFVSWRGVTLPDGEPAPINRATLAQLFMDPGLGPRARELVEGRIRPVRLEGNGSGLSAGGSSTPTGGPNTAAAAAPPTPPAAVDFQGEGESSAPRPSTPPEPQRAPSSGASAVELGSGETAAG